MNVSPSEAEEALAAIERMALKTRHSLAGSGAYVFLLVTGSIWLVGFTANQFLPNGILPYIWVGVSVLGSALSILLGTSVAGRFRGPLTAVYGRRIGAFWLLLILFGVAAIAVARPTDPKQTTMLIILFIMIGQTAMALLFSYSSTWWAFPITLVALVGYFWQPRLFFLWLAGLGLAMIVLALRIRSRW